MLKGSFNKKICFQLFFFFNFLVLMLRRIVFHSVDAATAKAFSNGSSRAFGVARVIEKIFTCVWYFDD